jgi:GT2 family glycosyltransferase
MEDLSIIIVSYNTKELTQKCIESILVDGENKGVEVVVVDNKSTDGSVKILRDLWRNNRNIILVENRSNLGFAKAVNIGIENARGKYILLLNSDTSVKKDSIEKLLIFAQKKSDAGVVGARLFNEDGNIQASCYNFPTVTNAVKEYILGIKGSFEKYAPAGKLPVSVECIVMAVCLITPQTLERVGYLDEKFYIYYEDIDYCKRVCDAGLKTYYLPEAEVFHAHGASGKSPKKQRERLIESSKIYHGLMKHYIINFIIKVGQKINK